MIITNGKIVTWSDNNKILTGQALLIQGNKISKIGNQEQILNLYHDEQIIDAGGQYIMPGLICAHTHFYGAYARGMAIPGDAPSAFPEILSKLWWPLDKSLDEKSVAASTWVCVLDAIKHGATTLFDHHASPNAISDSLDVISSVVNHSGIRASLCYEVTDRDGLDKAEAGIRENARFLKKIKQGDTLNGRLSGTFGLHASLTLSDSTLDKCKESNIDNFGFHIHVAEHIVDEYDSLKKSGKRVIDRLEDHGILGENSIVAHAVHVDNLEIQKLAESGTWVTHQPRSNMNNAVGIADVESMMRTGVNVCLGNDGFSNTMWDEWKTAYLVHKLVNGDPRRMGGYELINMAIYNNAKLATSQFGLPVGKLEEGYQADIIFVDYLPYTPMTAGNIPWHIVFGMQHSMITSTMVAGKLLYHNRAFVTIDEKKIMADAMQLAENVWKHYQTQF
ncbi:MAG: hydrolase [Chloroflexi bacterium HGW-Chloroflexi-10]|nr:MAG: hydrolase [Chloroflexi bacterium HGW-Chloroflexi-10]